MAGTELTGAGLTGQRILLGVSGGIAAYKAADLVRRCRDAGADVQVVMTEGAKQFVAPLTFQALSGRPVRDSLWDSAAEAAMGHIELARWATAIVIAPASADVIAKLAMGLAGDLLGTLCLASEAPVLIAPAMNRVMWAHPATQANIEILKKRGVSVLGPAEGEQACGEVGAGRLLEPAEIVDALITHFIQKETNSSLRGQRVVISAGPTYEDIDPVRFIGNRSSGKMGFALAAAAAQALGADVVLIAGPVALPTPADVQRIDVRSAEQMYAAVLAALPNTQVYIGAAAVADYAPKQKAQQKIKKTSGDTTLELQRTPDILAAVASHVQRPRLVVGFAAETQNMEKNAEEKRRSKGVDLIIGNDVSAPSTGFESDNNAVTVFSDRGQQQFAVASKARLAQQLMAMIAAALTNKDVPE